MYLLFFNSNSSIALFSALLFITCMYQNMTNKSFELFIRKLHNALYAQFEEDTDDDDTDDEDTDDEDTDDTNKKEEEKKEQMPNYADKYKDDIVRMKLKFKEEYDNNDNDNNKDTDNDNNKDDDNNNNDFKNRFVMETTPNGNVIMTYNNDKKTFIYYSDHTIPYRYLEVVSRKYVKMFNCLSIYIDMEEELSLFKENQAREKEKKVENPVPTKSVFARFKSYNANVGVKASTIPPPRNNPVNRTLFENKQQILKERANHYICEGKIANFSILKKPDKKQLNKKINMSFAEFKLMQLNNNNNNNNNK